MEATVETNPRKLALTNALIWAAINIAIFLVTYYVMPDMMGSMVLNILQLIIGIGLAVYFCMDLRKKIGGFWTFGQALKNIFLLFFVQGLIVLFFTIIFAKIEPAYVQKMKEIGVETNTRLFEKMGMSQDKIDEMSSQTEITMEKQLNPGIGDLIKTLCFVALGYFIGALIFAAIFKKNPPVLILADE